MKIVLFHDSLMQKGGAQRVVIDLASELNADIITCGFNSKIRKWTKIKSKIIDLGNLTFNLNKFFSYCVELPIRFFVNRKNFDYDNYIFSGSYSFFASKRGKYNIWFCHSPNRPLYDLKEYSLKNISLFRKIILIPFIFFLKKVDQFIIKKNISKIVVNSKNVQKRVRKYYGLDSEVIYPPIKTRQFHFNRFDNFFLAVSRLAKEKRIDLIAKSFTKMPDKKLILVGNGPEKNKIKKIIKNNSNIKLITNANDKKLIELYSNCLATIYIPIDEDFGLVPLEGMASGKACIAANEGGCKETVIHGKTGFLIKATEENIIKTIDKFNKNLAEKMKKACIKQAKKFDVEKCIEKWKEVIKENKQKTSSPPTP